MLLYSNSYCREGNDAWLEDYVYIHNDSADGLHLVHKQRWRGWAGDINDDYKR